MSKKKLLLGWAVFLSELGFILGLGYIITRYYNE